MNRNRVAAVCCISIVAFFASAGLAGAQLGTTGLSDGPAITNANEDCPKPKASQGYNPAVAPGATYRDGMVTKVNLYGKICDASTETSTAAQGVCVAEATCEARLCGGKPCALPTQSVDSSKKTLEGGAVTLTPADAPLQTGESKSVLEQAFNPFDPTPLSEQKSTISGSKGIEGIAEAAKEDGGGFVGAAKETWNDVKTFFGATPSAENAVKLTGGAEAGATPVGTSVETGGAAGQNTFERPAAVVASEKVCNWWCSTKEYASSAIDSVKDGANYVYNSIVPGAVAKPETLSKWSDEYAGVFAPNNAEDVKKSALQMMGFESGWESGKCTGTACGPGQYINGDQWAKDYSGMYNKAQALAEAGDPRAQGLLDYIGSKRAGYDFRTDDRVVSAVLTNKFASNGAEYEAIANSLGVSPKSVAQVEHFGPGFYKFLKESPNTNLPTDWARMLGSANKVEPCADGRCTAAQAAMHVDTQYAVRVPDSRLEPVIAMSDNVPLPQSRPGGVDTQLAFNPSPSIADAPAQQAISRALDVGATPIPASSWRASENVPLPQARPLAADASIEYPAGQQSVSADNLLTALDLDAPSNDSIRWDVAREGVLDAAADAESPGVEYSAGTPYDTEPEFGDQRQLQADAERARQDRLAQAETETAAFEARQAQLRSDEEANRRLMGELADERSARYEQSLRDAGSKVPFPEYAVTSEGIQASLEREAERLRMEAFEAQVATQDFSAESGEEITAQIRQEAWRELLSVRQPAEDYDAFYDAVGYRPQSGAASFDESAFADFSPIETSLLERSAADLSSDYRLGDARVQANADGLTFIDADGSEAFVPRSDIGNRNLGEIISSSQSATIPDSEEDIASRIPMPDTSLFAASERTDSAVRAVMDQKIKEAQAQVSYAEELLTRSETVPQKAAAEALLDLSRQRLDAVIDNSISYAAGNPSRELRAAIERLDAPDSESAQFSFMQKGIADEKAAISEAFAAMPKTADIATAQGWVDVAKMGYYGGKAALYAVDVGIKEGVLAVGKMTGAYTPDAQTALSDAIDPVGSKVKDTLAASNVLAPVTIGAGLGAKNVFQRTVFGNLDSGGSAATRVAATDAISFVEQGAANNVRRGADTDVFQTGASYTFTKNRFGEYELPSAGSVVNEVETAAGTVAGEAGIQAGESLSGSVLQSAANRGSAGNVVPFRQQNTSVLDVRAADAETLSSGRAVARTGTDNLPVPQFTDIYTTPDGRTGITIRPTTRELPEASPSAEVVDIRPGVRTEATPEPIVEPSVPGVRQVVDTEPPAAVPSSVRTADLADEAVVPPRAFASDPADWARAPAFRQGAEPVEYAVRPAEGWAHIDELLAQRASARIEVATPESIAPSVSYPSAPNPTVNFGNVRTPAFVDTPSPTIVPSVGSRPDTLPGFTAAAPEVRIGDIGSRSVTESVPPLSAITDVAAAQPRTLPQRIQETFQDSFNSVRSIFTRTDDAVPATPSANTGSNAAARIDALADEAPPGTALRDARTDTFTSSPSSARELAEIEAPPGRTINVTVRSASEIPADADLVAVRLTDNGNRLSVGGATDELVLDPSGHVADVLVRRADLPEIQRGNYNVPIYAPPERELARAVDVTDPFSSNSRRSALQPSITEAQNTASLSPDGAARVSLVRQGLDQPKVAPANFDLASAQNVQYGGEIRALGRQNTEWIPAYAGRSHPDNVVSEVSAASKYTECLTDCTSVIGTGIGKDGVPLSFVTHQEVGAVLGKGSISWKPDFDPKWAQSRLNEAIKTRTQELIERSEAGTVELKIVGGAVSDAPGRTSLYTESVDNLKKLVDEAVEGVRARGVQVAEPEVKVVGGPTNFGDESVLREARFDGEYVIPHSNVYVNTAGREITVVQRTVPEVAPSSQGVVRLADEPQYEPPPIPSALNNPSTVAPVETTGVVQRVKNWFTGGRSGSVTDEPTYADLYPAAERSATAPTGGASVGQVIGATAGTGETGSTLGTAVVSGGSAVWSATKFCFGGVVRIAGCGVVGAYAYSQLPGAPTWLAAPTESNVSVVPGAKAPAGGVAAPASPAPTRTTAASDTRTPAPAQTPPNPQPAAPVAPPTQPDATERDTGGVLDRGMTFLAGVAGQAAGSFLKAFGFGSSGGASAPAQPAAQPTRAPTTVTQPKPAQSVVTIVANPATVSPGKSSTLSWSATGPAVCTIFDDAGTKIGEGTPNPRADSPLKVSPDKTTTYKITCTGGTGSANGEVVVTVFTE